MSRRRSVLAAMTIPAALTMLAAFATACSSGDDHPQAGAGMVSAGDEVALFDSSVVHRIDVSFDTAAYDAMIKAYADSGAKEWIEATVSIDGTTYERAGMRLKGNSSLGGLGGGPGGRRPAQPRAQAGSTTTVADGSSTTTAESSSSTAPNPSTTTSAAGDQGSTTTSEAPRGGGPMGGPGGGFGSASADTPEELPWLIRLDEFVKGQDHQGYEDIVVRSNGSETSLNEAVALDLLEEAGLASQDAASTSFSVNGGEAVLRLAIEHPDDDAWQEANFQGDGALYKAERTGDWSYRGDDPAAYEEIWDQEGGSTLIDLTPLTGFLQFLNESDDATFATELPERLDVDAFARYLAMMDLVANTDDIDGPGNNAYLWYDIATGQFTVVPWDLNLAFGALGGGRGGGPGGGVRPGGLDSGQMPDRFEPPAGLDRGQSPEGFDPSQPPGGGAEQRAGGRPGGFGRSNVLVERFHATAAFEALYQEQLTTLRADLYGTGVADDMLASWVGTMTSHATDLVDTATIESEAAAISGMFTTG